MSRWQWQITVPGPARSRSPAKFRFGRDYKVAVAKNRNNSAIQAMHVIKTGFEGLLLLRPSLIEDARGLFFEAWNRRTFDEAIGHSVDFVQDNRMVSPRGVLRGLHYQDEPHAQGKLVSVLAGSIHDVAVDLRPGSLTYRKHFAIGMTAADRTMLWIPRGFAHGFLVVSDSADVAYKATAAYSPANEKRIRWDDPELSIAWPLQGVGPLLSPKDASAPLMTETLG